MDLNLPYNYDEFTPSKVFPWLNFENSPPLGNPAPDFPLWSINELDQASRQTSLSEVWSKHAYTVVEFGSFT